MGTFVLNIHFSRNDKGTAAMARLALIILMLTLSLSATAQSVGGNPLIGRQTATTLCVPCHQIGETHRDGPPSFVDIANMPSTTALSLKVFLRSNHRRMPNLIIPDSETDDLIAYILNLKQPSAPNRR
jgi:mono/diheme cytochrome c family protein